MSALRSLRLSVGILIVGALGACTTATPYQPYRPHSAGGIHGGYSEQQLAPDQYRVSFHGNSLTSRDRVEGYMLYRAAEITLGHGFDWFVTLDRNTEHVVRTRVIRDPFYRPWFGSAYDSWRPDWRYYVPGSGWNDWRGASGDPFWTSGIDIRRVESFESTADIQMRKGPMPAQELRGIDARRVIADLGPKIERPKS